MAISLPHSTASFRRSSSSELEFKSCYPYPISHLGTGSIPSILRIESSTMTLIGRHHSRRQCSLGLVSLSRSVKPIRGQTWYFAVKQSKFKVLSNKKRESLMLEARSIEEIYDALAERLQPMEAMVNNPQSKYIVGLAGPPGAGKSTLASEVVRRLNSRWRQNVPNMDPLVSEDVATVLPMDGFHLYRFQLDAMENPEEAHARRGAPWTFNPELLLKCLLTLRSQGYAYAPSFNHGVGDPVEDDVFVSPRHKVVIVEGNYLLLEEGVWNEISALFDEKWFIDINIDTSMQRVLKRHISTGKEPHVAKWRIEHNDRPNAELILKSKKNADLVIKSVDFQS